MVDEELPGLEPPFEKVSTDRGEVDPTLPDANRDLLRDDSLQLQGVARRKRHTERF